MSSFTSYTIIFYASQKLYGKSFLFQKYCFYYKNNNKQVSLRLDERILKFRNRYLLTFFFFSITGKRCEYLTSLSFLHNTSYVEFEPLTVHPKANVTIKFATDQENGVLLYSGESQHLAVELFRGRLR